MSTTSSDEVAGTRASSPAAAGTSQGQNSRNQYHGVRCRKWGKWVSEIRVPGTQDRLWLGTYSTPEAAAVAHDVASYYLRGTAALHKINFPAMLPTMAPTDLSPRSVQKAASDAGMVMDARFISSRETPVNYYSTRGQGYEGDHEALSLTVDDYL